jgi:peptide/nickel transport system substrate-binding protein
MRGSAPVRTRSRNSSRASARSPCATRTTGSPASRTVDEIEFVGISDETARINALLSGELDLVGTVNPRSVQRVRDSANHAVFETKAGLYTDLVMRRDNGPGSNPDFILAMKHLFDREQMKRAITLGHSVVANDQPIDPTNRFYFAGLPQRPFDLDKAKFHWQKANLGSAAIRSSRRPRRRTRSRWR